MSDLSRHLIVPFTVLFDLSTGCNDEKYHCIPIERILPKL